MLRAGDTIGNPVTGERIVFHKTAADTGGEAVVIECFVQPHGFVAAAHVHPLQEERFEVLRGTVGFRTSLGERIAGPGERITVPAGTPHKFWNAGNDEAHLVCEVRPALQFEQLLETMFALAADGKTNRRGMPNPLRLAVIGNAHFDTVRLPFPPAWIQRAGLALGAPLGHLLGYRATYEPRVEAPPALGSDAPSLEAAPAVGGSACRGAAARDPRDGRAGDRGPHCATAKENDHAQAHPARRSAGDRRCRRQRRAGSGVFHGYRPDNDSDDPGHPEE